MRNQRNLPMRLKVHNMPQNWSYCDLMLRLSLVAHPAVAFQLELQQLHIRPIHRPPMYSKYILRHVSPSHNHNHGGEGILVSDPNAVLDLFS